jgi:hypothetical protein
MKTPLTGASLSGVVRLSRDWTSRPTSQTAAGFLPVIDSPPQGGESFLFGDLPAVEFVPSPSESASAESGSPLILERTVVNQQFQPHLFSREELARSVLFEKLRGVSEKVPHWENFRRCGELTPMHVWCSDCGHEHQCRYRCSLRWCPVCMPALAYRRQRLIRLWSNTIKQPKHVVLTARNTETITRARIRGFAKALVRLRRSKLLCKVTGGCSSLEVTNEQRGWHLHAHLLLNVPWLDSVALAKKWAKLVGQEFAIVKVQDARGKDYSSEVCKYVVKGNALASWSGGESLAFIKAFDGIRNFTRFGSLRGSNEFIDECVKGDGPKCKKCKSVEVEMTFGVREFLRRYELPSPELS